MLRQTASKVLNRIGSDWMNLRWSAWENRRFGEPEIRLLPSLVDRAKTAVDVGASDGHWSLYLSRLAKHCIAFEPNPVLFGRLQKALPRTVALHCKAASSISGRATLRVPKVNGISYNGWGSIELANKFTDLPPCDFTEVPVDTIAIDDLNLSDVGFVKIDAEGHEFDILRGMKRLLLQCKPTLVVEARGVDSSSSIEEIHDYMDSLGYLTLAIDNGVLRTYRQLGSNYIFIAH